MAKKKRSSAKKKPKTVNVHKLIQEGDTAMETMDMERALSRYTAASAILHGQIELGVEEANPLLLSKVLGKLAEVKVSLGSPEEARSDFGKAVALLPQEDTIEMHETRASLLLYLGQLSSEQEALEAYQGGIEELQACIRLRESQCKLKSDDDEMATEDAASYQDALQEARRQLSAAYCTMAELYLTDLCFEENAEQKCEAAIESAMRLCDKEPLVDSLQVMASLRLSQSRPHDATQCMLQAYGRMKRGCQALAALVGLHKDDDTNGEAVELVDVDAANSLPGFEFRCQSAKLLLECAAALNIDSGDESKASASQCSEAAIQVLGSLLAENDEVIEVWYLLGCAFESASDLDAACQYWARALEMLLKVKEGLENDEDHDQLEQVNAQIEEVRTKLKDTGHDAEAVDVEMNS